MIPIKFFQLRFIARERLKKQGSVTYSAVQKKMRSVSYLLYLRVQIEGKHFKSNKLLNLAGHGEIQPTRLTNQTSHKS